MQKFLTLFSLSLLVFINACTPSSPTMDDDLSSAATKNSMEEDANSSMISDDASSESSSNVMHASSSMKTRIINMTVKNWEFAPHSVSLKKGERVLIRLTNESGVHSFASTDLGLNIAIQPGETKDIEISTDKAGTFRFRCSVPCGPGHKDMTGTIIIE